jgi:hypothetical protein
MNRELDEDMEGSDTGQINVLVCNLLGGTEETHGKSQLS